MSTIASIARLPAAAATEDRAERAVTDELLALRFTKQFAGEARFVAAWNRWLLFDGVAWRPDESLRVLGHVRAIRRAVAEEIRDPRAKARIGSAATVAAIERLVRADDRHAASPEQWDADPWLLNTPGGTVDLRTGTMRGHRREDYITKVTAVAPRGDGHGDCPRFQAFLARALACDEALIAYVQRALGYALAGVVAEHALFFLYGTGGNGKSVLLNLVFRILGSYAAVADGLLAARGQADLAELAALRGTRFVVAPENDPGEPWNERRIKALTGGDPVAACRPRGEVFTYAPGFKLFIAGNHKPAVASVDEAIRRRLNIIPFAVTIPAAEVDRDLPRTLEAEGPGILAWLIEGCRQWQHKGLAAPPAVTDTTADTLADEDTFGGWIFEFIRLAPECAETTSDLFASWARYAMAAQEPPGSKRAFAHAMRARGFAPCRIGKSGSVGFKGIRLGLPPSKEIVTIAAQRLPAR